MATNGYGESSPLDFDSLFAPPVGAPTPQSVKPWEFDEVLDIPKTTLPSQANDASLEIEEILSVVPRPNAAASDAKPASAGEDSGGTLTSLSDLNGHWTPEAKPSPWAAQGDAPAESRPALGANVGGARPTVAFPQDSFQFNKSMVVMTPPRRAKSGASKILVGLAVMAAILGLGYYLLNPLVREWMSENNMTQQAKNSSSSAQGNAGKPATVPTAALSASAKASSQPRAANAVPSASASVAAKNAGAPTAAPSQTPKAASAAATPAPTAAPAKPTPSAPPQQPAGHAVGQSDGSLTVQIGSFNDAEQARQRAEKLRAAGLEVRVVKAQIPQKGTWYRLQTGRFTSQAEADRYRNELRAKGTVKDSIVTGYQSQ